MVLIPIFVRGNFMFHEIEVMTIDSAEILRAVNEKDVSGWKGIYTAYYTALCVYANRLINDVHGAEDLVQEVLCNVWKSDSKFENVNNFTYYLYRAVYNQAMMEIRSKGYRERYARQVIQDSEGFSDEVFVETVREELTRHLYRYIDELPNEQRQIILLSIKGYTGKEIADELGIAISTVKTQKNRSFKYLREKLKNTVLFFLISCFW